MSKIYRANPKSTTCQKLNFPYTINRMENIPSTFGCFDFNPFGVLTYFSLYLILSSENKKELASLCISLLTTWKYVFVGGNLLSYYVYDLILMLISRDYLMILHHLVSIYTLGLCPSHLDYNLVAYVFWLCKVGDLFIHVPKIMNLTDKPIIQKLIIQFISCVMTVILWIYFRIYLFRYLDIRSVEYIFLYWVFQFFHILWIIKYSKLAIYYFTQLRIEIVTD
jgi:hypothetical protein